MACTTATETDHRATPRLARLRRRLRVTRIARLRLRGAVAAAWVALAAGAAWAGSEEYRLAPGDVIDVQVWREPDLSGELRVGEDGALVHVLAGSIPAAGETLATVTDRLRQGLERDYLREARVALTLVESRRRQASVLGAVEDPGRYPVDPGTRVLDLVLAAGGPAEGASGRATLVHFEPSSDPSATPDPRRTGIDLGALLNGSDFAQNLQVGPGDVLVVESGPASVSAAPGLARARVRVLGEVEKPGAYRLEPGATVLDAVIAAGGFDEYAAANRTRVVRGEDPPRRELRVRLDDVMKGEADAENPVAEDGDLIVVPESFF